MEGRLAHPGWPRGEVISPLPFGPEGGRLFISDDVDFKLFLFLQYSYINNIEYDIYGLRIIQEEEMLRQKFGNEFDEHIETRKRLIQYVS